MTDFLYIHPWGNPSERDVPVGAVGAINGSGYPFRGYYAWEPDTWLMKGCRLAVLDLHWFHSLPAFIAITRKIRNAMPEARIVAGGITAALLHRLLFKETPVDAIFSGHTEAAFRQVVERTASGKTIEGIPGVMTADTPDADPAETVGSVELDPIDSITIDWFPGLDEFTKKHHERVSAGEPGAIDYDHYYPFIPTVRGCETGCRGCYGSYGAVLFPGEPIVRSPGSILGAIEKVENDSNYAFVNFLGDFLIRMTPEQRRAALPRGSRLSCAYHFCDIPDADALECLRDAFSFSHLHINLRRHVFRPETGEFKGRFDALRDFVERVEKLWDVRVSLYCLTKQVYERCSTLAKRFPRLEVRDDREWYLLKPGAAHFQESGTLKLSRQVLRRTGEYQNSAIGYRLLDGYQNEYPQPGELPSVHPPREFMPGLARPPFTISSVRPIPDLQPGGMRLIPVPLVREETPGIPFEARFEANGPGMVCTVKATDFFTINYDPGEVPVDPCRGRVRLQPVFRLSRSAGNDEEISIRVDANPDGFKLSAYKENEILLHVDAKKIFEMTVEVQKVPHVPEKRFSQWASDLLFVLNPESKNSDVITSEGIIFSHFGMKKNILLCSAFDKRTHHHAVLRVMYNSPKNEDHYDSSRRFLVGFEKAPDGDEEFARRATATLADLLVSKGL